MLELRKETRFEAGPRALVECQCHVTDSLLPVPLSVLYRKYPDGVLNHIVQGARAFSPVRFYAIQISYKSHPVCTDAAKYRNRTGP